MFLKIKIEILSREIKKKTEASYQTIFRSSVDSTKGNLRICTRQSGELRLEANVDQKFDEKLAKEEVF